MKKALGAIVLVLLLVAGGAAVWWFFLRAKPVYKAEDILPPSTIALLQVSDSDQARARWQQTPLGRIWAEQEVQNFISLPRETVKGKLADLPHAKEVQEHWHWIERLSSHFHGEAFAAFLGFEISPTLRLQLVFGFDAREDADAAAKTVEEMAADLRNRYPRGVREEKEHLGVSYETWSPASGWIFCHAKLGNLFLFTTDEAALHACIELAKREREDTLAKDQLYQQTVGKVDTQRDGLVYFNLGPILGKFGPLLAMAAAGASPVKDLAAFRSAAISTRLEPTGPVDKIFVFVPEAGRPASLKLETPWERKSLPFVAADSVFYAVKSIDMAKYYDDTIEKTMAAATAGGADLAKSYEQFNALLATNGVNLRPDLIGRLGHEIAVQAAWGERDQFPQLYLMVETTDPAGFIAALDKLLGMLTAIMPQRQSASAPPHAPALTTLQLENKTIHRFLLESQYGLGLFYVDLDSFVVLTFQDNVLPGYLDRLAKKQIAGFTENPVYKQLAPGMPKTVNTFIYTDNKPLFEKIYNFVTPLAMLGAAMMPEQKAVDFSKLPKGDTIARHLSPSVSYQYMDADGVYRYSAGPVPPETPFFVVGLGAGFAGAGMAKAREEMEAPPPGPAQPQPQPPQQPSASTNAAPATIPSTNAAPVPSNP